MRGTLEEWQVSIDMVDLLSFCCIKFMSQLMGTLYEHHLYWSPITVFSQLKPQPWLVPQWGTSWVQTTLKE